MHPGILLFLPLLMGGSEAAPPALNAVVVAQDYDALVAEYDAAIVDHKAKLKATELSERRALRKNHPAKAFRPRFEALVETDGQALVWLIDTAKSSGLRKDDLSSAKLALYERIVAKHLAADWCADAMDMMFRDKKALGDNLERLALAAIESEGTSRGRGQAMFRLAARWANADSEETAKKGQELYDKIMEEYAGTELATFVDSERYAGVGIAVGKVAPDFNAVTADGDEFKLSDYRGKVTVIDFWGFW